MKKLFLFLFSLTLFFLFGNVACAQEKNENLTAYFVERVPFCYTDDKGEFKGLVIDRVRVAFEKAGISFKFKPLPAKRHMKYLEANKDNFCTIGWYKNEKREKIAKYSEYIYQNKTRIALAAADNNKIKSGRTVDEVFQNKNLTLLLKDGYSYGGFIDGKISKYNPVMLKLIYDSDHMIKMIHNHRADYYFTSEEEAERLIPKAGFKREDFKYIRFSNMPVGLKRYILYSKKVDNDLIKKVDEAIRIHIH